MTLTADILDLALDLGFDAAGVAAAGPPRTVEQYDGWLRAGHQGEMAYLAARADLRRDPRRLLPEARSMIVLLANYASGALPAGWDSPERGRIARYAWPEDYHAIIVPQLHALDAFIRARTGREAPGRACVDTAPLLERDFAVQAGLGFIGRNTCLITPGLGSWTHLAALLVPEVLEAGAGAARAATDDRRAADCGRCTRCLDACPTHALVAPHVLDARRCISYLTIELRGVVPAEHRERMGNWVFGCDVCQEVCPYNRAAPAGGWRAPAPHPDRAAPPLIDLLATDALGFRSRYRGTAVSRAKRRGLVRNACIAAGNSGDPALAPALAALLADDEPLVRTHAAWALGRLGGPAAEAALGRALRAEADVRVCAELNLALARLRRGEP